PLSAGRETSVRLIEDAARGSREIAVFTQREAGIDEPAQADLHRVGTVAQIHKVLKQPDGTLRLVVQGLRRVQMLEVTQRRPFLRARVEEVVPVAPAAGDVEAEALARNAATLFRQVV